MSPTKPNAYAGNPSNEWAVLPHWDDLAGNESQGTGGATLTYAAFRDTPFKLFAFRNAQNDELHLRFQMPHGWDPETSVKFHIHTVALTDPAAEQAVRFEGQYAWVETGGAEVPANAAWTTFAVDFAVSPGDVNLHRVAGLFEATPPDGAQESAILLVYVKRAGGAAEDTYTGNLAVLSLDVHLQRVKIGTLDEHATHG